MEIEIGQYVRTKDGIIAKVTYIDGLMIDCDENVFDLEGLAMMEIPIEYKEEYITKHSKNIIALIEDKEIVEIEYYVKRRAKRITRVFEVEKIDNKLVFLNRRCSFLYDLSENKWIDGKGYNPKIKTILTHEQFEQNVYRLEE